MSSATTGSTQRRWWFWIGFAVVTLLIAGAVSYLASSSPDGLDSATLKGCEVVETFSLSYNSLKSALDAIVDFLGMQVTSSAHPTRISPIPPPYLPYTSPTSRPHLAHISPTSRPHLRRCSASGPPPS